MRELSGGVQRDRFKRGKSHAEEPRAAALVLMGLHLAWAVVVMFRNRPAEKKSFHKFSLVVWAIWLVPYFTGAIAAMA